MVAKAYCSHCRSELTIICGNCGNELEWDYSYFSPSSSMRAGFVTCKKCNNKMPICSKCKNPIEVVFV